MLVNRRALMTKVFMMQEEFDEIFRTISEEELTHFIGMLQVKLKSFSDTYKKLELDLE